MLLNYTLHDAEAWAAFSGDHNPIHFDLDYVRKIGSDQLSVHGMRALLDMKRQLSTALLSHPPAHDYYAFSARLRQPVWCQTPYQMLISSNSECISGKLLKSASQESCFSGKLSAAAPLELTDCNRESTLSVNDIMALSQYFPGEVSDIAQTWSFIDALLFKLLVASPEALATFSAELPELAAATLLDIFTLTPVMQTHHETHFSAQLLQPDVLKNLTSPLHYAIQPMLVMGDKASGYILRAVIQARLQHQPLMTTAVTLKTWPLANH